METFGYDADGNLTSDGQFTYGWDAENRLTSVAPVSPAAGSQKIVYGYDYQSRRTERKVYDWDPAANGGAGDWESAPSESRAYVYYGRLLLLEYDMGGVALPSGIGQHVPLLCEQ